MPKKITKEEFINRSILSHSDVQYGYDKVEFHNLRDTILIYCPDCQDYFVKKTYNFTVEPFSQESNQCNVTFTNNLSEFISDLAGNFIIINITFNIDPGAAVDSAGMAEISGSYILNSYIDIGLTFCKYTLTILSDSCALQLLEFPNTEAANTFKSVFSTPIEGSIEIYLES